MQHTKSSVGWVGSELKGGWLFNGDSYWILTNIFVNINSIENLAQLKNKEDKLFSIKNKSIFNFFYKWYFKSSGTGKIYVIWKMFDGISLVIFYSYKGSTGLLFFMFYCIFYNELSYKFSKLSHFFHGYLSNGMF